MDNLIPVIDLFAGPGGLGEGFSIFKSKEEKPVFKIKLSIEKELAEHRTLELRSFYRQFGETGVPSEYYEYIKGNISREKLFNQYPMEAFNAKKEAWHMELCKANHEIVKLRIEKALGEDTDWILIGGPPCQAYSLVGRARMRGQSKWKYARDQRHFLYKEYLQTLADHQPPIFIMENVKGLLSSKRIKKQNKNTFELIISDLRHPLDALRKNTDQPLLYKLFSLSKKSVDGSDDLEISDFIVRSEEYGIPQARHRIFIFGIRSDILKNTPDALQKTDKVGIEEVIGDLPRLRSGLSKEPDSAEAWRDAIKPIAEAEWLKSLSPKLRRAIINASKQVKTVFTRGATFTPLIVLPLKYADWYVDGALGGVCNHETRSHIREDLHRYFFAAVFAQVNGRTPTLRDFPKELLPNHKNAEKASKTGIFSDRFRVQVCGEPSKTIVSHISQDGHYYIHYDPLQCRSLTVREAARLQTFPDNYYFEGNRTQQYHQVGNAVPPMLAKLIAEIAFKVLKGSK